MTELATVTPIHTEETFGMRVENIQVVDRHRKHLGDIDRLVASIGELGLLQPVVVTRDGRLVAGQRRLEACKRLGWTAIPVVYAENFGDALSLLRAERDENTCRKDMVPSELAALGAALEQVEADRARERQRHAQAQHRERDEHGRVTGQGTRSLTGGTKTADAVGEALGMSGRLYQELQYVHRLAHNDESTPAEREIGHDALAEMDGGAGIKRTSDWARQRRRDLHEKTTSAEPPATSVAINAVGPDWIPHGRDKTAQAAARRRELIREHASHGWTSGQIADVLDMDAHGVRRIARQEGIPIPADEAIGRNVQKKLDSNRMVREIVARLDGIEDSLAYVNFLDLDPAEASNWITSLGESIRALNRIKKRLKEVAGR